MTLKKPTIVLFDMDGTTVRHLHPRVLHALERLDDAAHKLAKAGSKLFRRPIDIPALVEKDHQGRRPKLLVHRALHKIRRKPVEQIVEPCPGIYNVLELLRRNDIVLGLVSNGLGKGYGHDVLQTFDLEKYFAVTIFREDIKRSKPHPDPLLKALSGLPRPVESGDVIWYIGDRHKDVAAALAAREFLPCEIQPLAYGLNAAIAILERQIHTEHIFMAWQDLEQRLKGLLSVV